MTKSSKQADDTLTPSHVLTTEEREETEIYTADLSCWDDETYTLYIEEMEIFVELLNSICMVHSEHIWIGISGENKFEEEVANALTLSVNPEVCLSSIIAIH